MHKYLISKRNRIYVLLILMFAFGPLFFSFTNPEVLPLPLLVVPFVWLFCCLFVASWLLLKIRGKSSHRQMVMVSGTISTIPVLLVVFQSIHQLSLRDVLLSVGLVVLTAVYMLRADFIK